MKRTLLPTELKESLMQPERTAKAEESKKKKRRRMGKTKRMSKGRKRKKANEEDDECGFFLSTELLIPLYTTHSL
jgi:hypothetical protein